MSYKKTAKDLAFDREKAQLQKKIRQLNEFIGGQEKISRGLTEAVEARDAEIRVKDEHIERLLNYANLSEKDAKLLLEDAKRRKELAESMRIFSNVGSFF